MSPDKGVFKRKGSDVWQHRVFIPKDLRSHYGGKSELPAKSLGTRDLKEANSLARERQAEFERDFAEKRALAGSIVASSIRSEAAGGKPLTPQEADRLAARFIQTLRDRDFDERLEVFAKAEADPDAFWTCKILPRPQDTHYVKGQPFSYWDRLCGDGETPLKDGVIYALHAQRKLRLARVKEELQLGQTARIDQEAEALLRDYDCAPPTRRSFVRRLMLAEAALLEDLINGSPIEASIPAAPPIAVPARGAATAPEEAPLLSAVSKAWIAEKTKLKLTPLRIEACERAVELFIEVSGDKAINSYTKTDIRDFKEILIKLPPNRNKIRATRGMKARTAAKKAASLGLEPMSIKTVNNKYIAPLRNLFDYAEGNYEAVEKNPFNKAAFPERTNPRTEWDPFDIAALTAFFNAPLYRGCESAKRWLTEGPDVPRDSARFWVPLLLLYTGARVNEICKLRPKDIGEEVGVNYLSIEWEDDDDSSIAGRVKNATSHRRVPLHDDLVSFGFLEFADRALKAGHERLFPELKPNKYGKLYAGISQRFSDTFLPGLGIKTDKTSLKSFRHNFVDAARNSRIPHEIIQALKGDTFKGTIARYGNGETDLEILASEMKKLKFKGLDLSHLIVAQPVARPHAPGLASLRV